MAMYGRKILFRIMAEKPVSHKYDMAIGITIGSAFCQSSAFVIQWNPKSCWVSWIKLSFQEIFTGKVNL